MNSLLNTKIILPALAAMALVGCAESPKQEQVVYSNVIYSADTRIDSYFDDQFKIYSAMYPEFTVKREGQRAIRIVIPAQHGFAIADSTLNRTMRNRLADMSKTLNDYRDTSITILGHTDSNGGMNYNLQLAQSRAESVKSELLKNHVHNQRIKTVAESYEMPLCPNTTKVGQECNRRVEILIEALAFDLRNK